MSTDPKYFNANKLAQQVIRTRGTREQGALGDTVTGGPDGSERKANTHYMDQREMFYTDGADAMANKGFVVGFHHVPSGKEVYLKAFITAYNETFSPDWAEEKVYGRADPIYLFKQTTRVITVGIKVPAASAGEAFENLAKIQSLTQFLYPTYTDVQSASTIAQSPLIRLQVMNLAQNQGFSPVGAVGFGTKLHVADAAHGLLGVLRNLSIVHNLEGQDGVIEYEGGGVLPKLIDINFDFAVIHEHALGWDEENNFANPAFPYGVRMSGAKTKEELRDLERENARAGSRPQREQRENETLEEAPEERLANIQARYANLLQSTGRGFRAGDIGLQARGGLGVGILEEATDFANDPADPYWGNIEARFSAEDLEILTGPGVPMTHGRDEGN
tara:strand:- start:5654 stop:6820 length:1167 start_codon:yes stop_codon:yes gene_type:complete